MPQWRLECVECGNMYEGVDRADVEGESHRIQAVAANDAKQLVNRQSLQFTHKMLRGSARSYKIMSCDNGWT